MGELSKAIRDLHSPTFDALWDAHLKEVERLRAALEEISVMWTGINTAALIARNALAEEK